MIDEVDFEEILALFRSHGYELKLLWPKGIWGNQDYAVFKSDNALELPWLIPVGDNGKVDIEYVKKFTEFLKERGEI
jgi:hypothetical protein